MAVGQSYLWHLAHVTTGLCAPATHSRAPLHFIAVERIARLCASLTYFRAGRTFSEIMFRVPRHEIRCRLASLNAVIHDQRMVMSNVGTTHIEAMVIKGVLTGIAALPAQLDANLNMFRMISHNLHSLTNAMPH
ncbi:hypothetical protein [Asticcacaulis sp. AC466]|uniref:hypothetical protein n=1 Tax=Asticcacaulis sp. AC466 TaxID=1282362 RepID=UPI0012DC11C5|nr:hypothetical protein [Asticcacaulis sp. AC466]